ncbi:MAG: UDP-N-acetylmuramate--L-alanine ligase [Gemmatimonadales bacterium]
MGIAGAGMSALALIAKSRGVPVTGCDIEPGPASDVADAGIDVFEGHDTGHVNGVRAVVYTAAVAPEHVELQAARDAGVPVVRRADALSEAVAGGVLAAIAGTHGKTTTSAMVTVALRAAGLDPTGIVGGRVDSWGGNASIGKSDLFVVEADEYDRAFLSLDPDVAVINNIESDHLECYGTVAALEAAFAEFGARAGRLMVGADDRGAARIGRSVNVPTWQVGLSASADLRISDVGGGSERNSARLTLPDGRCLDLALRVPGIHNLRNAAMAVGTTLALDGDVALAAQGLNDFGGVDRRFQVLGTSAGVTVVDDYAHHPTEVVVTIGAARQRYPGRRLVAVFQPHLYSRTQSHGEALGIALAAADIAVVTDVYPAREKPIEGVSGAIVFEAARRAGAEVEWISDLERVPHDLAQLVLSGDVVLTMGAGTITEVGPALIRRLSGTVA